MQIKSLNIKNFKSIVDITINEPNPFTVFVGPNGSGKSNIFEALEFYISERSLNENYKLFGGESSISNRKLVNEIIHTFEIITDNLKRKHNFNQKTLDSNKFKGFIINSDEELDRMDYDLYNQETQENEVWSEFTNSFSRVFIKNIEKQKINYIDDSVLSFSASNLEKVLKRLLENEDKREEISDWLSLFIPEFERIEVQKSQFSSNEDLLIYQKHYNEPFNKELISDGTYNIIALLTAVYQSDEPQFLCIEEPENGLHPKVIKELVNLFRDACERFGHYIWINTHSQTLVSKLEPNEIILVDKKEGQTKIKQVKDINLHGFEMDEAWLSNALGGGLPW